MNNDTFQQKAAAAAAKMSGLTPAEVLAQSLATDRPTIESAVKSFLSLTAARSIAKVSSDPMMTTTTTTTMMLMKKNVPEMKESLSNTDAHVDSKIEKCYFTNNDPQLSALKCARFLLRELNQFYLPDSKEDEKDDEVRFEYEVVEKIWNGLIKSEQKPSRFLGQMSLIHVYPIFLDKLENGDLKMKLIDFMDDVPIEEARTFLKEFGAMLEKRKRNAEPSFQNQSSNEFDEDDDSALLWERDRGAAELARRRQRREKNKQKSVVEKDSKADESENSNIANSGVVIEELNEDGTPK